MTPELRDVTPDPIIRFRKRDLLSHKGDYGHILIIGGQEGMAGAVALAGLAAMRAGAGKVTLAVPRKIAELVAGFHPCLMIKAFGTENSAHFVIDDFPEITKICNEVDIVAIGPGMGRAPSTLEFVRAVYQKTAKPLIVDADALRALNIESEIFSKPADLRILTPHPGEFQNLTGNSGEGSSQSRGEQAAKLCRLDESRQTMVVLKGHSSIVCDGDKFSVNASGNPGMATGGTGDCLTGIIAAIVARKYNSWESLRLAVYLHGLAGDVAAETYGEESLIATDLMESLPIAWNMHGFVQDVDAPRSPLMRKGKAKGVRKFKHKNPASP